MFRSINEFVNLIIFYEYTEFIEINYIRIILLKLIKNVLSLELSFVYCFIDRVLMLVYRMIKNKA